jgi:hypothetical protein
LSGENREASGSHCRKGSACDVPVALQPDPE